MAEKNPTPNDVFEVSRVRQLIELMNEFDMSEVNLRQGDQRIHLRKKQDVIASMTPMAAPAPVAHHPAPTAAAPAAASASAPAASGTFITSPMVGTYYASSKPDAPAYVKVGDQVGPESIVCIIEAMKVFNEIPAEMSGKITAVLVQTGDAVEYGQKLFQIEK